MRDTLKELAHLGILQTIQQGRGRHPSIRLLLLPDHAFASGGSDTPLAIASGGSDTPLAIASGGSDTPLTHAHPYRTREEPGKAESEIVKAAASPTTLGDAAASLQEVRERKEENVADPDRETFRLVEDVFNAEPRRWTDVGEIEDLRRIAVAIHAERYGAVREEEVRRRVVEWTHEQVDRGQLSAVHLHRFLAQALASIARGVTKPPDRSEDRYGGRPTRY